MKLFLFILVLSSSCFCRHFESSVDLAKKILDESIAKIESTDLKLKEEFRSIRLAFDNPFKFSIIRRTSDGNDCYASVYKKNYYQSQKSKIKINYINI